MRSERYGNGQDFVLEGKGITNTFGGRQTVHDGLDIAVRRGEIMGIVGGSGTGKSVLMRTLTGLHKPDAGQVLIEGQPMETRQPAERAATLSVLFQQGALFSGLNVIENIMVPLREFTQLSRSQCEALAMLKLEMVGLQVSDARKATSELSGGMIKRVALARALAMDSKIIFLDEPTAGLDPLAAAAFDALIEDLNKTLNLTVVIITHDLDTLFTICQRVAVLVDHKVQVGTLDALLQSEHPWIKEYFHGPRSRAAQAARKAASGNVLTAPTESTISKGYPHDGA